MPRLPFGFFNRMRKLLTDFVLEREKPIYNKFHTLARGGVLGGGI